LKVYIGPYIDWFGPYQLAGLLEKIGVSENRCHKIGGWLGETWVGDFLEWRHSKKKRGQMIIIDNYDIWSAYHTMAMIILPVLKKLKEDKTGTPWIDDEDAPWYFHSKFCPSTSGWDDNCSNRWEYVLDEMIWAFENLVDESWEDRYHHGDIDRLWLPADDNKMATSGYGPKHTYWFDHDGYKKHEEKIDNGLRLFAKYFRTLWT
jgi:hypothetical protein